MCVCSCRVYTVSQQQLGCLPPTVLCSAVLGLRGELYQDLHIHFLMPERNYKGRRVEGGGEISTNSHESLGKAGVQIVP